MRISAEGQVTLPEDVRTRTGLMPGSEVELLVEGNTVRLVRADHPGRSPGRQRVERFAGTAARHLSTDEVLRLTRGGTWDDEPPGVLG